MQSVWLGRWAKRTWVIKILHDVYYPFSLICVWAQSMVLFLVIQVTAKTYLEITLHRLSQVWNCSFEGMWGGWQRPKSGAKLPRLAGWLLCVSFLFTPKLSVPSLSFPTGWTSHLPTQERGKRGKSKTNCPTWEGCKQHGDVERAWPGAPREAVWVLATLLTKAGPWDSHSVSLIYSAIRWEQ